MPTYGTPGASTTGPNRDVEQKRRDRYGKQGETRTARQLEKAFGANPDIFVFHDLHIPNAKRPEVHEPANIDHAVLTGSRLVLLDSKLWSPGFYWTVPFKGRDMRGLKRFPAAETRTLGMAEDRYALWLPPDVRIWTITTIWQTKPGFSSMLMLRGPDHVRYLKARRAPTVIGALLRKPEPPDQQTVHRLLEWTRNP